MEVKTVSRRTEIAYKAEGVDEVAQHAEVQGCTPTVNAAVQVSRYAAVIYSYFVFYPVSL